MAQSNACPTGDQKVMVSIPAEFGNISSRRLIMKYHEIFSTVILLLR